MSQYKRNKTGRNSNTQDLPSVGAGQELKASDINNLSSGIDRVGMKQGGNGLLMKQTPSGTSLSVGRTFKGSTGRPWSGKVSDGGGSVLLNIGKVFNNKTNPAWFESPTTGEMLFRGAEIKVTGFHILGTYPSTSNPLNWLVRFAFSSGQYYLERGINAGVFYYEIKKQTDLIKSVPTGTWLLFTVKNSTFYQNTTSDINDNMPNLPLQVIYGGGKAYVTVGAICGIIPSYDGGGRLDTATSGISASAGNFVYAELTASSSSPPKFPLAVKIKSAGAVPTDTKTSGFIGLAQLQSVGSGSSATVQVNQLVSGCLWAERLRWTDATVYRYWRV